MAEASVGVARLEGNGQPAAVDSRPSSLGPRTSPPGGRAAGERLQALIDSSPLALVEFGLDTRIRLWNPAAERIFGWSREEMLGRGGLPMAPPAKRAESEELFARVRAGESINDYETVRQRKDGTLVAVSIAAAPVRDGSGRVVGNLVAYTDITERKAQEERLQALIDSSPLALVEFGLDTRIRLWNPAAERIFGWSREEMLGRGGLPMAPPSKRAESQELFERVLAGASVNDYETVRQRKDGALVAVSIAAAPVRDGSGRVVGNLVAYTDITERKAQEAEVHRLNAELHARLEELAASRARIVTAGDVERRRLERNLHDGAQQRLVTLSLSLRLALAKLDSDPAAARAVLAGAGDELALALAELRELARGLHPAVLTDRGLRPAVEMLAGRAPRPGRDRGHPRRAAAGARRGGRVLPDRRGADQRREVRQRLRGARPGRRERRECPRRGIGRRRRRRRPGHRLRPPGPGGSGRGAGRLARSREPGRRRDVAAGRDPGQPGRLTAPLADLDDRRRRGGPRGSTSSIGSSDPSSPTPATGWTTTPRSSACASRKWPAAAHARVPACSNSRGASGRSFPAAPLTT